MLTTERLILRPLVVEDAEALFPALSDPATMHWWSHAPLATLDEARTYLARDTSPWRSWAITLAGGEHALGWVSAGEKRQGGVTEIGYLLSPAVQGQGIAREAVTAVIDRLFSEGQRRVFADTDPENEGSIRLLQSLGFQREGLLRAEWETHIGVRDSVIWGLLRGEWGTRGARAGLSS